MFVAKRFDKVLIQQVQFSTSGLGLVLNSIFWWITPTTQYLCFLFPGLF